MASTIELDGVSKAFLAGRPAVDRVSLALDAGEFFCLLGPSGCGKSTLLRLIGGYLSLDSGAIRAAGNDITHIPPEMRQMGMVFQNYALFPQLSAAENVAFGLRVRRLSSDEVARRVAEVLDWVGLAPAEAERRPRELSGGQQQRVALARALVIRPRLLMLDEPFANLDRALRERLRDELRALQRRSKVTTILVTHDREEAMTLADRVGVLQAGALVQLGAPRDVYEKPATEFVAGILGPATLLPVHAVSADSVELSGGVALKRSGWPQLAVGDILCVRPENWRIGPSAERLADRWIGTILNATFAGARTLASIQIAPGCVIQAALPLERGNGFDLSASIAVGLSADAAAVIPPAAMTKSE